MNNLERRVLTAIEHDLLRELHRHADMLTGVFKREVEAAEFSAIRYKERECYERLIELKRAHNVLNRFLHVTKK